MRGRKGKASARGGKPAAGAVLAASAALALVAALLFAAPVRAGEVLMTRSGFDFRLMQKMLPREQRLDALEARASALENRLAYWEDRYLSRIHLWPDKPLVEYFGPGGVPVGSGSLDVPPRIVGGRTLVPLRFVGEALGAEVVWNAEASQVAYITDRRQILMTVGQTSVLIDGRPVEVDTAPVIVNDRTLVPVRFVSQWLGAVVRWDEALGRVEIGYFRQIIQQ